MPFGTSCCLRAPSQKNPTVTRAEKYISSTTRLISKKVPSKAMGSQRNRWKTSSSMHQLLVVFARLSDPLSCCGKLQELVRGFPDDQHEVASYQRYCRHPE